MPLLGAHMSIAGGYYKAANAAAELGMDTVQIFTKNNNQWAGKPLSDDDIERFRTAVDEHGLKHNCSHASYLINLGSPDDALWTKSIDAMVVELERAEALGLEGVVMHPGAHVKSGEDAGLERIAAGIDDVHRKTDGITTKIWLEATAGQGSCLGHRFEHLAHTFDNVAQPERLAVCIDTCHIFAAGYPLIERKDYLATIRELDTVVGLDRVEAFHLNDSKKAFGSRVDRHDHIGEGELGLEPFRHVLNDKRFKKLPMFLETKKEERDGQPMDAINLQTLKSLLK